MPYTTLPTLTNRRFQLLLAVFLVFLSALSQAKEYPWEQVSSGDLTIYAREVEGQVIREVKIEGRLHTSIETLLTVLGDIEQFPDWVPYLDNVEWLQKPDNNGTSYIYIVTALPWPVSDRDMIIKTTLSHDSQKKEITLTSTGVAHYSPTVDGFIRIPSTDSTWIITDSGQGYLDTTLISHADPGGYIPKWLANYAVVAGPKKMFNELADNLNDKKWATMEYDMNSIFGYPNPMASW